MSNSSAESEVSVERDSNMAVVVLSTLALLLLILVALAGNTLVCVAFYRTSSLRSVTNVFIVSLAATDIMVALFSIPIWLSVRLSRCLVPFRCNVHVYGLWLSLEILFSAASIINLSAISIDRLIAITSPLKYPSIVTKTRATVGLLAIWLFAGLLATLVIARWKYYSVFVFVVAFCAPLTVMLYSYTRIFRVALSQVRRVFPAHQQVHIKREYKAARTLAIVMGTFIICWAPFFLMNILVNFYEGLHVSIETTDAIKALHYTNSALNPIIYSCSNRDFRRRLLGALPGKCRPQPQDGDESLWNQTSFRRSTLRRDNGSSVRSVTRNPGLSVVSVS